MTQTASKGRDETRPSSLAQIHEWTHRNFLKRAELVPDRRCRIALAPAEDPPFLEAITKAYRAGFVEPILAGDQERISQIAENAEIGELSEWQRYQEPDPLKAVAKAAELVKQGQADALMRGHILVYDFFKVLFHREHGLRGGVQLSEWTPTENAPTSKAPARQFWSQVGVLQIPDFPRLLIISDCGLNVNPGLDELVQIVENAIGLAHSLGITAPRVALLAAVEAVYLKMPVLVEESIVAHFSRRGGIKNAVVDGPLSLDLAISPQAVEKKNMKSEVAGKADILIVNNIYVGNSLYKSLVTLGGKTRLDQACLDVESASVVVGGDVPIVFPSRSESPENVLHSLALAAGLWAQQQSRTRH
jgi:phosphate butyryltransferase